jgi:cytochrome P450
MSNDVATGLPAFPFTRTGDDQIAPALTPADGPAQPPVGRVVLPTGRTAWLVTRHEDVRQLLRSPAFTSDGSRPEFPLLRHQPPLDPSRRAGFFLQMDPPEHTLYRRILTPEFMIKAMRRLEPLIVETVTGALADLRAAGPGADLIEHVALPVPSMVICHLLGVPYADHGFFQERSRILLDRTTPPAEVMAASDDLRGYLGELIAGKLRGPATEDLLGRLAVERVATGQITENALRGIAVLLLIAGHETTANMIGLSTLVLLRQPDQWRRLRERPELIDDAVEELLRYLTIVRTGLPRLATEDVEIGGQLIRAGEGAIALLAAANRDPEVFPDGDRLDLERGSHSHLAFGFGVHQCIGQPLARAELRVTLRELVTTLPDLALAVDPAAVELRDDAVIFGVARLPVTW